MTTLTTLLDDLTFPEGPRWHDGRLWLSDFYVHEVIAVDLDDRGLHFDLGHESILQLSHYIRPVMPHCNVRSGASGKVSFEAGTGRVLAIPSFVTATLAMRKANARVPHAGRARK